MDMNEEGKGYAKQGKVSLSTGRKLPARCLRRDSFGVDMSADLDRESQGLFVKVLECQPENLGHLSTKEVRPMTNEEKI
jgi:hypothetical protein